MKKIGFLMACILVIAKIHAQYQISFAANGAANAVTTVKVENLTKGTSLILNGNDTLNLTFTTDIDISDLEQNDLKLYPNPMNHETILALNSIEKGYTQISVFNISGEMVSSIQMQTLDENPAFRITGLDRGIYLVRVISPKNMYQKKLISIGSSPGNIQIAYLGKNNSGSKLTESENEQTSFNTLKSALTIVNMQYTPGDQLRFTGTTGIYTSVMNDVPTQSKTITFTFVDLTPPSEVTNLSSTVGNGYIKLTWNDPTDPDFQKIELSYLDTVIQVAKGLQTEVITNLTNGITYTFTVKTIDIYGNKSIGIEISASPNNSLSVSCQAGCDTMSWSIIGETGPTSRHDSCNVKYSIINGEPVESERNCSGTITFLNTGNVYHYTLHYDWNSCTMEFNVAEIGSCSDKKKSAEFCCNNGEGVTFFDVKNISCNQKK